MLSEYEEKLFEEFSKGFIKQTKQDYLTQINRFKESLPPNVELLKITPSECAKFISQMATVYSTSTCEKIYSYLHSFYEFLKEQNLVERNAFSSVKKPYVSRIKSKDNVMSFDEMNHLIEVVKGLEARDRAIITFLITTGCTLSEVAHIRWCDFMIDEGDNAYCKLGKNANERTIKLHPSAFNYILEYRGELGLPSSITPSTDYIFVSKRNNKQNITDRTIQNIVSKAFERAGLTQYSAKDLRHTFASFCLYLGMDKEEVKEQMGWYDKHQAIRYKYVVNFIDSKAIDTLVENNVFKFSDEEKEK